MVAESWKSFAHLSDPENIHQACGEAAERILRTALERRTLDNVTGVVIAFEGVTGRLRATKRRRANLANSQLVSTKALHSPLIKRKLRIRGNTLSKQELHAAVAKANAETPGHTKGVIRLAAAAMGPAREGGESGRSSRSGSRHDTPVFIRKERGLLILQQRPPNSVYEKFYKVLSIAS